MCFSTLPPDCRGDFEEQDASSIRNMLNLHSRVRDSGLEVYDGYPARYGGMRSGKASVVGLEEFGQRVIDNLWNALQTLYPLKVKKLFNPELQV